MSGSEACVATRMRRHSAALLMATLTIVATINSASASDNDKPGKVIAGWIEKIFVEDIDFPVKAKLDTGALTSSMHALDIEKFERDGKDWVRFTMDLQEGKDPVTVERPVVRAVRIKSHDGDHDRRYVVKLDLCFDGRRHNTQFTLADRSQFIYPILLGRRFLSGLAVVDSESRYITHPSCPEGAEDSSRSKAR